MKHSHVGFAVVIVNSLEEKNAVKCIFAGIHDALRLDDEFCCLHNTHRHTHYRHNSYSVPMLRSSNFNEWLHLFTLPPPCQWRSKSNDTQTWWQTINHWFMVIRLYPFDHIHHLPFFVFWFEWKVRFGWMHLAVVVVDFLSFSFIIFWFFFRLSIHTYFVIVCVWTWLGKWMHRF